MSNELLTTREKIFILLITSNKPISIYEIMLRLKINREKEVCEHINHIFKSSKRRGYKIEIIPPKCKVCGFTFSNDRGIRVPSKCPKCRSNKIIPPKVYAVKLL